MTAKDQSVAKNASVLRMVQAGVVPVTRVQVMLEWQRDRVRKQAMMP